jgi:hypothetical protein
MVSLAIAALLLTAMTGLVNNVFETEVATAARNDATRDGRFAMQRMTSAVIGTERLMLPLADNANTDWREHVREQAVPASSPEGSSTLATAVLAVTLDPTLDLDADGFKDADNDKDGRVDEDPADDATKDLAPGIVGIDDDGDGAVDEGSLIPNDDEDENDDEDPINGVDDDGDGAIDEDPPHDANGDGESGVAGVDDDGDGLIDEAHNQDDDEDGVRDEDWLDPVVFFVSGTNLIERRPNLNPADGLDYTEFVIAENVTGFRVERIPDTGRRSVLVDITLELMPAGGEPTRLNTRVRVGGGR